MRVLPLALAAAIFSGVTAILIYLSGLSSCNAPAAPPRALSPFSVLRLRVVWEILTRDGSVRAAGKSLHLSPQYPRANPVCCIYTSSPHLII